MLDHQHISVLQQLQVHTFIIYSLKKIFLLDDPWSADASGRNSANTTSHDPWQAIPSSSNTQTNAWPGNHHTATTANNNNTGLSVNIADPWGVSTTDSRTTTSPPTGPKTVDNELSEFFGANASKISS
jgi:hypothetical protein